MKNKIIVYVISVVLLLATFNIPVKAIAAGGGQTIAPLVLSPKVELTKSLDPIKVITPPKPDLSSSLKPTQAARQAIEEAAAQAEAKRIQDERNAEIARQKAIIYSNDYDYGQCTWYVATKRSVPGNWGNAGQWLWHAQNLGWPTGATPQLNAIATTSNGFFGHVAFVIGVGQGTVTVSEMNSLSGWDRIDIQTYPASYFYYIY